MRLILLLLTVKIITGESATSDSIHQVLKDFNEETFDALLTKLGIDWTDNEYQETLLHISAREGYYNASEALIAKDPSLVNAADKHHRFPLHFAARHGHCDIVKLLVDNGADVNALGKFATDLPTTPPSGSVLYLAAFKGEVECVKTLLEGGADVSYQERDGETALHAVCQGGSNEVVKLLINKSPQLINVTTKKYLWYPLDYAARNGYHKIVKSLVDGGADVNALSRFIGDNEETSPSFPALYFAARNGQVESVQVLLDKGANINHQTNNGKTALHIASQEWHYFVVSLLVERGANITIKDNDGKTALQLATNKEIIDYLKEKTNSS